MSTTRCWRSVDPEAAYDAVILGGGGHVYVSQADKSELATGASIDEHGAAAVAH